MEAKVISREIKKVLPQVLPKSQFEGYVPPGVIYCSVCVFSYLSTFILCLVWTLWGCVPSGAIPRPLFGVSPAFWCTSVRSVCVFTPGSGSRLELFIAYRVLCFSVFRSVDISRVMCPQG